MHYLWFKNAVVYSVDVDTFFDGNGDGTGDFRGLTNRLDYLAGLGVTCLWLLPFYPSPNRDNGYDVIDYYGVDPRLGTLGDFVEFTHRARDRGIRVIVDLVVNHTSDQHPWFQAARKDRASPYREYYVWSEEEPEDRHEGVIFPGVQESTWTWDEEAGAWYMHRFYKHQPDLNITHRAVRDEIRRIMGFWLQVGVSGFRIDAAPFLVELKGVAGEGDEYAYLEEFRSFLSWRKGDAITLAEANVETDKLLEYFGDGDRMHMLFNFQLNQQVFLGMARGDARPIREALQQMPEIPPLCQFATFLRNHDELDLGRLTDEERGEAFAAFAPDPGMRLYERGIRRRLAPMLNGDRQRLELAYSLLFSLPGTPVIWYGEEIGMGEDLSLSERNSVRTPMQWTGGERAGFSSAPLETFIRPIVGTEGFAPEQVNVARQQRDGDSLLNWIEHLIRIRKECPEIGWGTCQVIDAGNPAVLAHRLDWEHQTLLALHNLSGEPVEVSIDVDLENRCLIERLGDNPYRRLSPDRVDVELGPYGYRWYRAEGGSGSLP